MKNLIIASTSTVYGLGYLEYLLPTLDNHFRDTDTVIFIPYARPGGISHDDYTTKAAEAFSLIGKKIIGLHTFDDPVKAIKEAGGIFTGGGNTFLLVQQLYRTAVMSALKDVLSTGIPYLGCSAGSNITGLTMETTNDMPIVYPPSFKTLGMVPFNLNPHYLDPEEGSTHMGETREMRIREFHHFNSQPVLGLREGSWLEVRGTKITLNGTLTARLFRQNQEAVELPPMSDLSHIS